MPHHDRDTRRLLPLTDEEFRHLSQLAARIKLRAFCRNIEIVVSDNPQRGIQVALHAGSNRTDEAASDIGVVYSQAVREYSVWRGVIERTSNPKNPSYATYGACGIDTCDRWLGSFSAFYADMGPRGEGMSLDRLDNRLGYWCGRVDCASCGPAGRRLNCRWADKYCQRRNQRRTKLYTFQGKTQSLIEWAHDLGFRLQLLQDRQRRGWTMEDAFMTPTGGRPARRGSRHSTPLW